MEAILFRKLVIDDVNYYQLYRHTNNFEPDDRFTNYDNRANSDFFYIDANSDILNREPELLDIYTDVNGELVHLDDEDTFTEVFSKFFKEFNICVREERPASEIVDAVNQEVMYQHDAIRDLVDKIKTNQKVMASSLPMELKLKQKDNILFYGDKGVGKKSIVECLSRELNMPCAVVEITPNLNETLNEIARQLLDSSLSHKGDEASYGVVFIKDNFTELMPMFVDNVFTAPSLFTRKGIVNIAGGDTIDFSKLTFVVLFDQKKDGLEEGDINSIMASADCHRKVHARRLTDTQKYHILLSPQGRLYHYRKFLEEYGHKLVVDEKSLKKLIRECSKVDAGMDYLNAVIDGLVNENKQFEINDVYIDEESILPLLIAIKDMQEEIVEEEAEDVDARKQDIIEDTFDDELDRVFKAVTKSVIGQDRHIKKVLYRIIENQRIIRKPGAKDGKKRVTDILIRGETGTGKTMMIKKICGLLNVPYFIADSTDYTEAGWKGYDIVDVIIALIDAANGDVEAAQNGVVAFDEIDKKAPNDGSSGPSREAVLNNLLAKLDGTKIPITYGPKGKEKLVMFDTSRLTVIVNGAFEGIDKYRDRRLGIGLGFTTKEVFEKAKDAKLEISDFEKYGLNTQFTGRFPLIVELNKITEQLLIDIMKQSDESVLEQERMNLQDRGIGLEYTDDFYEKLAAMAIKNKTGARGFRKAINDVLFDIVGVQDIRASKVSKIILSGRIFDDPREVIIVERDRQKKIGEHP